MTDHLCFGVSLAEYILVALYAFFTGMESSGIMCINTPSVPFVISALGPMRAMGYMLPIIIAADIFSIIYYKKSIQKKLLIRMFPFALLGIVTGLLIGKELPDNIFKKTVGILLAISLCFIIYNTYKKKKTESKKRSFLLGIFFSYFTGLSSVLGASGSPIILTYFLLINLEKEKLIGTSFCFYILVDLTKLPLYIFVWKNISAASLAADLALIPVLALGIFLGLLIVKKLTSDSYKFFIIAISFISAVKLFF